MDTKSQSLIEHFKGISDPRVDRRKLHDLTEIIVVAICSIVAGANNFEEIEIVAKAKIGWFKKFLTLENGIPSHDTFERVFARIDPKEFRRCFSNWIQALQEIFSGVIAIDGQTHRGAKKTGQTKSPVHMVSAWAADFRLVLGQVKVDEKSNEITAIPDLLKILDINGCIVTIDALGCQQKIAEQIIAQGGDYILGLKGNQGRTLAAVEDHFSFTSEKACSAYSSFDKGHGRIETRSYFADSAGKVIDIKDWPGIKSVIKLISTREIGDKSTSETRFYLSSISHTKIQKIGESVRSHWGIENSLHYILDVTFKQDKSRVRNGNATENFGVLRHIAMNILTKAPSAKGPASSKNLKRVRAACDPEYLGEVMRSVGLVKSEI
jgi:predicted transposase YbfD/YdcC